MEEVLKEIENLKNKKRKHVTLGHEAIREIEILAKENNLTFSGAIELLVKRYKDQESVKQAETQSDVVLMLIRKLEKDISVFYEIFNTVFIEEGYSKLHSTTEYESIALANAKKLVSDRKKQEIEIKAKNKTGGIW